MNKIKTSSAITKNATTATANILNSEVFQHVPQATIICVLQNGQIINANKAACKLLGYSKSILLTHSWTTIFAIKQKTLKELLKKRQPAQKPTTLLTVITKNGRLRPCELAYTLFSDDAGRETVMIGMYDRSNSILQQSNIDNEKEKIVAGDIIKAKSRQKKIDIQNEKIVSGNIVIAISKQKKIDLQNEKIVANDIVVVISKQKKIDVQNEKIVSGNIVKAISKQKKIDIQNKKTVADNIILAISKQKKIDIKNEKIVSNNIVLAISKQKKIDVQNNKIVTNNILLAKSKQKKIDIKKEKIVAQNIMLAREKQKGIDIKKAKIVAKNIISEQKKYRITLAENNKAHITKFNLATKLSFDGVWDWNVSTNEFFLGEGFGELFGYSFSTSNTEPFDWTAFLHPDDKKAVAHELQEAVTSQALHWEYAYRIIRKDASIATVLCRASIIRDADGVAQRMIGVIHDVSKQQVLEERLAHEIQLKELQIVDATEDARLNERSDIGKELHDNINQLLGASRLYVDLAKRGGENTEMYLSRSSQCTITAIEEIRKLTKGLTTDIIKDLGLCEAIRNISRDTMEINQLKISCALTQFTEKSVNDKFKINMYRIIQEQLNNILKHAKATKVIIKLLQNRQAIKLIIADNGVGFNTDVRRKGIGVGNIKNRAISYNGTAAFESQPGKGCILTAIFSMPGNAAIA